MRRIFRFRVIFRSFFRLPFIFLLFLSLYFLIVFVVNNFNRFLVPVPEYNSIEKESSSFFRVRNSSKG